MSQPLKVGDRVRVIGASHESGYRYGDRGTVHRVDETPHGTRYHVAMDKAGDRHHGHLRHRRDRAGRLSHCRQADSYRLGVPEASASRITVLLSPDP